MEARDGNPATIVKWEAFRDAAPSSFFHLVSFLERVTTDAVPVGSAGPPAREAIRFRHDPDLGFHSAEVPKVEIVGEHHRHFELTTTFLGLSGTASPLPAYMVEDVLFDTFEEGTQRDFLDVFHHRAVSLLYRAVIRLDPARVHRSDARDPWLERLLGLGGVRRGTTSALDPRHLMLLLPVLVKRSRGVAALRAALSAVLHDAIPEVCVRIREFAGQWTAINEDQWTRLGKRNHALGEHCVLGRRVYDERGRFAVRIGILTREQADLFERGHLLDRLRAAVSLVLRDPLEYDVELVLGTGSAHVFQIGVSRLGRARLTGFRGTETVIMRNVGRHNGINQSLV